MNFDVGLAYPLRYYRGRLATVGGRGNPTPTNDERDAAVRAGVYQVLATEKGERVMLGDFGAGLGRFVFDPIPGFASLIPLEVRRAVSDWCPRAVVTTVKATPNPVEGEVVVALVVRHNDSDQESILRVAARSA